MGKKITLLYEDNDLPLLQNLVQGAASDTLKKSLAVALGIAAPQDAIKHKAYAALSDISGYDIATINDEQDLTADLGLSSYHKKALKNYFNRILEELGSQNTVTIGECQALKKVKDCTKLIKSKL